MITAMFILAIVILLGQGTQVFATLECEEASPWVPITTVLSEIALCVLAIILFAVS
jgi:hypothetical protein